MRTAIIAVLYMALSAQALAWTAMPCCGEVGDDAPPASSMNDGMHHDMTDQTDHTGCADDGNGQDTDHTADNCCPGAFCSGVFAALSPDMALEARPSQADVFMLIGTLPNAPPEQLLRPPIT